MGEQERGALTSLMPSIRITLFKEELVSAQAIIGQWRRTLGEDYLPDLHGHQVKTLAALSYGIIAARDCSSGQVSLHVPGKAKPASVRRRQERLLANERLESLRAMEQFSRHVLQNWSSSEALLILDETPKGNDLRCMKISVGFKKRVIPLMGLVYRPNQPPEPMPRLLTRLLRRIARLVPPGVTVTLLMDRGLCWPEILRLCRLLGWHWVGRLQSGTRFRDASGQERAVEELVKRPGQRFYGQGQLFKKAGWMQANVVAVWEKGNKERWLLVTDRPASYQRCRQYCRRTWCEETHRDEKSSGFQWQHSHVDDPLHAQRLVLLMALSMLLLVGLGAQVIRRGWRKDLDPHRQRRLSVFQLGQRYFIWCLAHDQAPTCPLARLPPRSLQ